MKRLVFLLSFAFFGFNSWSQLPDGSVAPDFTVTDVNGQSHNLYSYLAEGKSVFLDFFATWCGPCWSHHQGGALQDVYDSYGPNGTDEVMVIMVEVDWRTNVDCMYGPSGCNAGTQGDWITGTNHPMADDASLNSLYNVSYFPTIYGVCPNKILTELGRMSSSGYINWHRSNCALELDLVAKDDARCFESQDGRVEVEAKKGTGMYTYTWSNGQSGDQISNLPAGEYYCTVSDGGKEVVGGPYFVQQPDKLLFSYFEAEDPSCQNGNRGSIELSVEGGTPNYQMLWNDGVEAPSRTDLEPGTYTLTVEDANDCQLFGPEVVFEAVEIPDAQLTSDTSACELDIVELGVREASSYDWSNGENTRNIEVDVISSETYYVTVTYSNGCVARDSVFVEALELPIYDGNRMLTMNCQDDVLVISPQDDEVPSFSYSWESLDGSDLGDANTDEYGLEVQTPGLYQVTVMDQITGCSGTSVVEVQPDANIPQIDVLVSGEINCIQNEVVIDASNSSQGANFQYTWTASDNLPIEDGNTLNPIISRPGVYNLTIVNTDFGCDNSKNVEVVAGNIKAPNVSIGYEVNGIQVEFYNESKFSSDSYTWYLPNDQISYVDRPSIDASTLGNVIEVCLETENICGLTEKRCQTLDLQDESYYFSGRIIDQFNENLGDVKVVNSGSDDFTNQSGQFAFVGIDFNENVFIAPEIGSDYQQNDVNEEDLLMLLSALTGESELDSKYLEYAADINEDGRISTADLVLMRQYLLRGVNGYGIGSWMIRDMQCAANDDKQLSLDCNPYIEVKLIQSSQRNNNFLGIQKGDLSRSNNGNLFSGDRKSASQIKKSGSSVEVPLLGGRLLSLQLTDYSENDMIYIDGARLDKEDFYFDGETIKILKIFATNQGFANVEVVESRSELFENKNFSLSELTVIPNPVRDYANVSFTSAINGMANWNLYHSSSMKMILGGSQELKEGDNTWSIHTGDLSSGVYLLVMDYNGKLVSQKILVHR